MLLGTKEEENLFGEEEDETISAKEEVIPILLLQATMVQRNGVTKE